MLMRINVAISLRSLKIYISINNLNVKFKSQLRYIEFYITLTSIMGCCQAQ